MQAIIVAEHSQCDLAPLTGQLPHPLLPLAGKTILLHALEMLHRNGIREVTVVAPTLCQKLEAAIDTGPLLGMNVKFGTQLPSLAGRQRSTLMIGLRDLCDANWPEMLNELGDLQIRALIPIRMTVKSEPVALLLPPGYAGRISSDWADVHLADAVQLPVGPLPLVSTGTLRDYYHASFQVLQGKFRNFSPAGRESAPGHRMAPKARISPDSIRTDHAYLGAHCRVDRSAILRGRVIVGENSIVSRGARVTDSIILDDTCLGVNTDCSNAIVSRNLLIRVDTGVSLKLDDPLIFGAVA